MVNIGTVYGHHLWRNVYHARKVDILEVKRGGENRKTGATAGESVNL